METFSGYLKGILQQILDSYQILNSLQNKPGDLDIIKKELFKINGFLHVITNKLEILENNSNDFVSLLSVTKSYFENYDFFREIDIMSNLYSSDSDRLRNLRQKILEALQDKNLVEKIQSIIMKL